MLRFNAYFMRPKRVRLNPVHRWYNITSSGPQFGGFTVELPWFYATIGRARKFFYFSFRLRYAKLIVEWGRF